MPHVDAPHLELADAAAWRAWLKANHGTSTGVWLILRRPSAPGDGLDYPSALDDALCYGWIDAGGGAVDATRWRVYFAPRKPRSVWSAPNKARLERLMAAGRMRPPGVAAVERAQANGSWTLLDSVERLEVPDDLADALRARPPAADNFAGFPPSARKSLLSWLVLARRPATRAARIFAIAAAAEHNERARG